MKLYGGAINKLNDNYKNRITRRIAVQYLLTLMAFIVAPLLLPLFTYNIRNIVVWQATDLLYIILRFIEDNFYVFAGVLLIFGWAFITYRFMGRPLRYLDEVISTSEKLAHPTDEQIILSDALSNFSFYYFLYCIC